VPVKATPEQIAEICEEALEHERGLIAHFREFFPNLPQPRHELRAAAFDQAAQMARIVGTYPDEARKFFGELLERHANGR
jgi:hypothetical protein